LHVDHGREGKISEKVIAVIGQHGRISTRDLKSQLDEMGVETRNLNQLLAYLKRNERVVSTERGFYALPR
jgi:hypothetical protein